MLASTRPPTQTMPKHSSSVTRALLVLLVVLVIGAPSLVYPFGRDQGEHAIIAELTLMGRLSYRDVFNPKPPATHLVHVLALTVFGHSMQAIRWLDLLWQAATALVLLGIADRLLLGRRAALLAPVLYSLAYYSNNFWNTAQTDGFLNLPAALAVLAYLRAQDKGERWAYAASGAAIGVAVLFKYPIGILLPLLWVCAVLSHRYPWRAVAWMSLGGAVALISFAAGMSARGTLKPLLASQVHHLSHYTQRASGSIGYLHMLALILRYQVWLTLILALGLVALALSLRSAHERALRAQRLVLGAWFVSGAISYLVQAKGFLYHGLPILAPYAVLGADIVAMASDRTRFSREQHLASVALATLLVAFPATMYYGQMQGNQAPKVLAQTIVKQTDVSTLCRSPIPLCYSGEPGFSLPDQLKAADYIARHTAPNESLFIWGFEPTIYFVSGRVVATSFPDNLVLFGDWDWPELRRQLLADLERRPPRYIVVASNDALPMVTGTELDSRAALQTFPELHRLIETAYVRETSFGYLTLYRRLGP